jgi:phospholipid/cholesterol/gamma-HCH transport system substrate-binding protein
MSAGRRDEQHLELKVGAMILVALVLLVSFVLILGDWSLKTRHTIEIHFYNPGGLSGGAPVKVAGRKVGAIEEITFLGQTGPKHPVTGLPSLVRCRVEIEEEVMESLRADARFYITTKGVLGDPFLEIEPGVDPAPLDPKGPVFGVDPPRLDMFLADAAELVTGLNALLGRNSKELDTIIVGLARIVGAAEGMIDADGGVGQEGPRLSRILENVEGLVGETRQLVTGAREKFIDDPSVERSLDNLESLSRKLDRDLEPLLADVRRALEAVDRLGEVLGPEEQAALKDALGRLDDIARRADGALTKVDGMVDRMRKGEGTVGQLLGDEELYDDLKELIRDLKRHPWKLIWQD